MPMVSSAPNTRLSGIVSMVADLMADLMADYATDLVLFLADQPVSSVPQVLY